MKILDMSADERPREKLLARGASALSDGELLAILIRTGTRYLQNPGEDEQRLITENALDIARRLLSETGGKLVNLFNASIDGICRTPGIGRDKAATLVAAFELGRRFLGEKATGEEDTIFSSRKVFDIMLPKLKGASHEECWVMFLSASNHIISLVRMNIGDAGSTIVDAPAIIKMAMEKAARGMILIHNHPSSNPHPSEEDIRQTALLKEMSTSCGIMLLDHVIIGNDSFYSFADER